MVTFKVPGNCVPKQRPRHTRRGRTYTPSKTLDYEAKVKACAIAEGAKPSSCRVRLRIHCIFNTKHRRDLDNCIKTVMDGLNNVAWEDDHQVDCIEAEKSYNKDNAYTHVTVDYYKDKWNFANGSTITFK